MTALALRKRSATAETSPIDPIRAQRLAKKVVGQMMARGAKIGPFERDDFEQELLLYCYDHEEQRRCGNLVREPDTDSHILVALKRRAEDWRQWAYDSRSPTADGVGFSTDNRDFAEAEAFGGYWHSVERIEKDEFLLGDDRPDTEVRIRDAIDDMERSLRVLRAAVPPESEVQAAITRALRAKPGESNETEALRRCVAWAAWRLCRRGRSHDVRLMIRRYKYRDGITTVERNRLARDLLPDMAREMNRYLRGERDYEEDGPGTRKVRRRYTPGDGDSPWDQTDMTVDDPDDWIAHQTEFGKG